AGLRILMYHRVTAAHPKDRLCVPTAKFDAQMRHLRQEGYQTVRFSQVVAAVSSWQNSKRGTRNPEQFLGKTIVLTFDDGYEDNFVNAASIMERYGFTGCFFVPSAFVESGPNGCAPEDRPMSWEQLKELLRHGHEIGAHSVTHRKLTMLGRTEVTWELSHCKEILEQHLDCSMDWFCYPAGAYDASIRDQVQTAGFRGACTVRPGANHPGANPFELNRTEISGFDRITDFRKKLAGAYDWLHAAIQWSQAHTRSRQCANAVTSLAVNGAAPESQTNEGRQSESNDS
ncbi:MAG: polysaccharide deacetylase family protein, partial [Candidatus Omnitrophica bacterium]|nr:polysaccharide deacetylase family protein [Candidatus Omnitrophota bacterium]